MRWLLLLVLFCGTLRASARPIAPPAARKPKPPRELIPYRRAKQWGYANAARRLVIRPQYDYAERFDHDLARVWKNDKCGFINPQGKVVVPIAFDRAAYHLPEALYGTQNDRAATLRQLVWPGGRGLVVVFNFSPPDTARPRSHSLTEPLPISQLKGPAAWLDDKWLQSPGKWGLYDSTGSVVLALNYAYLHQRTDGLLNAGRFLGEVSTQIHSYEQVSFLVFEEQLITRQGRVLLGGQAFKQLLAFHHGLLLVASTPGDYRYNAEVEEMTLIDTAQAARPRAARTWYSQIEQLGDDGFIGIMDEYNPFSRRGDTFEDVEDDWGGVPVLPKPTITLLGRDGQPVSPQQYVNLRAVAPGRALASIITPEHTLRQGLLDTHTGQWVLPPIYEALNTAVGTRLFLMRQQKRWGIVDSTGRVLVAPRYEKLEWASGASLNATYTAQKNGKWGVINCWGRELVAPLYDDVYGIESGYRLTYRQHRPQPDHVLVTEQHGVADRHGRLRIPVVYEDLRCSLDEKDRPLPVWEATRAGRLVLLDTTGRRLLGLGASTLGSFRRNVATLFAAMPSDSLERPVGRVQLDTTGPQLRAHRLPLPAVGPPVGELLQERWRTPAGQLLVRYTRYPSQALPPDSSELNAHWSWLTTADSTVLLPPIYHDIEPQQRYRWEGETPIGSFLRVRRGALYGVVTAEGRPVLPVKYPDVLLPFGLSGVFWVKLADGYAALDAQQRILWHTHSLTSPRLPTEFANGYGLLLEFSGRGYLPVGYVDALGRPFFREK